MSSSGRNAGETYQVPRVNKGYDNLSNHVSITCQAGYRGHSSSCLVVLWAPGFKHRGQNSEGGSWHFVTSGSSNWASSITHSLGLLRMAQEARNQVSDCRATGPLQWKWFSPARRAPTHCHFKVTTSAPFWLRHTDDIIQPTIHVHIICEA